MAADIRSVVGIHFAVSSAGAGAIKEIAKGIQDVTVQSQVAARAALRPLAESVNQVAAAFPAVTPQVAGISSRLDNLTQASNVSAGSLKNLQSGILQAAEAGGPLSGTLVKLGEDVKGAIKDFTLFRSRTDSLRLGADELAQDLGPLASKAEKSGVGFEVAARSLSRATTQLTNFTTGASLTGPQIERMITSVREWGSALGMTGQQVSGMVRRLQGLAAGLSTVEATAKELTAAAIQPLSDSLRASIGAVEQAPPSLLRYQAALAGLETGRTTVTGLTQALVLGTEASQDLAMRGYTPLAQKVQTVQSALVGLKTELNAVNEAQDRQKRSTRGVIQHSEKLTSTLKVTQSAAHGMMLGTAILTGNIRGLLFNIIFLRFSVVKLLLVFTALTVAIGGLAKGFASLTKNLITAGRQVRDLFYSWKGLTGSIEEAGKALGFIQEQAIETGFTMEDLDTGLQDLYKHGLLTTEIFQAVGNMAAGMGKDFADAAAAYAQAIGETEPALKSLIDWGIEFTEVENEKYKAMGKVAAILEVNRRIMEKHGDAVAESSVRVEGAMNRIRSAISATWAVLGEPVVREIIIPVLNAVARFAKEIYYLVRAFVAWAKSSGLWQAALNEWRRALEVASPVIKDLVLLIKVGLVVALYAGVTAFRLLGRMAYYVARAIAFLWRMFKLFLQWIKPVWDALRMLAQALKDLNFRAVLQAVKELFMNLPAWLKGAILALVGWLALKLMEWLLPALRNALLWVFRKLAASALLLAAAKILGVMLAGALMYWAAEKLKDPTTAAELVQPLANLFFAAAIGFGLLVKGPAGAIVAAIMAPIAIGILGFYRDPDMENAWKGLLEGIAKDFRIGKYWDAIAKVAVAITAGLVNGLRLMFLGIEGKIVKIHPLTGLVEYIYDMSDTITEAVAAAMRAAAEGDYSEAASQLAIALGRTLKRMITEKWPSLIVGGLLAAILILIGVPAPLAFVMGILAAAVVATFQDEITKEIKKRFTLEYWTGVLKEALVGPPEMEGVDFVFTPGKGVVATKQLESELTPLEFDILTIKAKWRDLASGIRNAITEETDKTAEEIERSFQWQAPAIKKTSNFILLTLLSSLVDKDTGLNTSATVEINKTVKGMQTAVENKKVNLTSIGKTIADYIYDGLESLFTKMTEFVDRLLVKIREFWREATVATVTEGGGGGGGGGGFNGVPRAQHGLIATKPTLALIGERGPEGVFPLRGRGGFGTTVQVFVQGNYILDDRMADRLAEKVGASVMKKLNRRTQLGFIG